MSENNSGSIGFVGLLSIVFIVLKLCHVINWSWWLVLLPLYGGLSVFLFGLLIIGTVYLICRLRLSISRMRDKK